jgi:hypothetical protein
MIFLAITPKGLADALKSARENDHVWCGKNAVPENQYETLKTKVTIFTHTFIGSGSLDDLQGAVWTMEDHHPGHTVWVEQIPSE